MWLVGKRRRREELATPLGPISSAALPRLSDNLLYIRDTLSQRLFLVDTGATVSVFPHRSTSSPAAVRLQAAGGQTIPSWGQRTIPLSFASTSTTTPLRFSWDFTLAAVDRPILGADFLRHHQLDVSLARHLLISANGEKRLPLMSSSAPASLLAKVSATYQEILADFPEIVGTSFSPGPSKHDVRHHVETRGPPISTPARRLDPEKYAKAEFEKMEAGPATPPCESFPAPAIGP